MKKRVVNIFTAGLFAGSIMVLGLFSLPFVFAESGQKETPQLIHVWPSSGGKGQVVTLEGSLFGNEIGSVIFKQGGKEFPADIKSLPRECQQIFWRNATVVIGAPHDLVSGAVKVQVKTKEGVLTNDASYTVTAGSPTPVLCGMVPDNGPAGVEVTLYGSQLGKEPGKVALAAKEFVVEKQQWSAEKISFSIPQSEAATGKVRVVTSNKTLSNPLFFSLARCSPSSCEKGESCCSDGSCRLKGTCEERVPLCRYSWNFFTGSRVELGGTCSRNEECTSQTCEKNVCVRGSKGVNVACSFDAECSENLSCQSGLCKPALRSLGASCTDGRQCLSQRCVGGSCAAGSKQLGSACRAHEECASSNCYAGRCAQSARCVRIEKIEPTGSSLPRNALFIATFNQLVDEQSARLSANLSPKTEGTVEVRSIGTGEGIKSQVLFRPKGLLTKGIKYAYSFSPTLRSASSENTLSKCVRGEEENKCARKEAVCSKPNSSCTNGSRCTGVGSVCSGKGTVCTGAGSKCLDGALCIGTGSTCLGRDTRCTGTGSVCRSDATCSAASSRCAGAKTQCTGAGSECSSGASCTGRQAEKKPQSCVVPGSVCVAVASQCSRGAQCTGLNARASGQGTISAGNGGVCTAGSTCLGSNARCSDTGTTCSGSESECSAGAICTGTDSRCIGSGTQCRGQNNTCVAGATCDEKKDEAKAQCKLGQRLCRVVKTGEELCVNGLCPPGSVEQCFNNNSCDLTKESCQCADCQSRDTCKDKPTCADPGYERCSKDGVCRADCSVSGVGGGKNNESGKNNGTSGNNNVSKNNGTGGGTSKPCASGTTLCGDNKCYAVCPVPPGPASCNKNNTCDANEGCACSDCYDRRDSCEQESACLQETEQCRSIDTWPPGKGCPENTFKCTDGRCVSDSSKCGANVPVCTDNASCEASEGCNCKDCDAKQGLWCGKDLVCSFSQKKCVIPSAPPQNNAACTITAPTGVLTGEVIPITVALTNNGTKEWHPATHSLSVTLTQGSRSVYDEKTPIDVSVKPTQSRQMSVRPLAPATTGAIKIRTRMFDDAAPFGKICETSVTVTTNPQPFSVAIPDNFRAGLDPYKTEVLLAWEYGATSTIGSFEIQRAAGVVSTSTDFRTIARPSREATLYTDRSLNRSTVYHYRIRAVRGSSVSGWSAESEVTIPAAPAVVVKGVSEFTATPSATKNEVSLSWKHDDKGSIDGFLVERAVGTSTAYAPPVRFDKNSSSFTDTKSLSTGTLYSYRIQAYKKNDKSPFSSAQAATLSAPAGGGGGGSSGGGVNPIASVKILINGVEYVAVASGLTDTFRCAKKEGCSDDRNAAKDGNQHTLAVTAFDATGTPLAIQDISWTSSGTAIQPLDTENVKGISSLEVTATPTTGTRSTVTLIITDKGGAQKSYAIRIENTICDYPWQYPAAGEAFYDISLSYCTGNDPDAAKRLSLLESEPLQVERTGYNEYLFRFADLAIRDALLIRVYENSSLFSLNRWYQTYGANKGGVRSISVNGIAAFQDASGVYVPFFDNASSPKRHRILYLSKNTLASQQTTTVFNTILSSIVLTGSISGISERLAVQRDETRLGHISDLAHYLENYRKRTCDALEKNPCYPELNAGSYIVGQTLSAWPSWQRDFGNALQTALPSDPFSATTEFGCTTETDSKTKSITYSGCACSPLFSLDEQKCTAKDAQMCYNPRTCWDDVESRFFQEGVEEALSDVKTHAYTYTFLKRSGSQTKDGYRICAKMEYLTALNTTGGKYCIVLAPS